MVVVDYAEFAPGPPLRPFVRCHWRLSASHDRSGAGVERIVPDGCPEIIVNRADRFRRYDATGRARIQAPVLLIGQFRRAITIEPTGVVDLIGVRFEPGGLHALLGVAMVELVDEDLCLSQLAPRLCTELEAAAHSAEARSRHARIDRALLRQLERRGRARPRGAGLVGAALERLERGPTTMQAVAGELGLNRRTLERMFRVEVGLSPKLFARIGRLQRVLQRLDAERSHGSWAQLATEHGFVDQSHLIRDFHSIVGTTPERYLRERTALASCFETGDLSHSSNR